MPAARLTQSAWTTEYDTLKRQELFQHPPKDKTAYPLLQEAIAPHVDSFNAIWEERGLLHHALQEIGTKSVLDGNPMPAEANSTIRRNKLSIRIRNVTLGKSEVSSANKMVSISANRRILPSECRERHCTYRGQLTAKLQYRVNNQDWREFTRGLGYAPIMLRSKKCHLAGMAPADLVNVKEESDELGGYFIMNGNEKLVRMLVINKRNYPIAIERTSFQKRGSTYTKYGVQIRSVRPDETSQTNVLHYLNDGNVIFRFSWRKNEYLVPVLLVAKALVETNDREIFEALVGAAGSKGIEDKQFVMDRVELLLRTFKKMQIYNRTKARCLLGEKFRPVLGLSEDVSDEEVGTEFLRKIVLPHLGCNNVTDAQNLDKFRMLMFMARKLYAFVEGECSPDNPDATSCHEVLLGGFLYGMILKENLEEIVNAIRRETQTWLRLSSYTKHFTDSSFETEWVQKVLRRVPCDVGNKLEYFMSTGNLISPTGLDLQQTSGYTVGAEKINFHRFISHFRMVHRGSFFAQMKTTSVRKLLPEGWGFLCPVHTPDGAPCGLLNHLAHKCKIATEHLNVSEVPSLVAQLGVATASLPLLTDSVCIQLDGRILGFCSPGQAKRIHDTLRFWKVEGTHQVPKELEIGYIPNSNGGQYPGIYMFSQPARFYRPVKYLPLDELDFVGALEQPFMSIAVRPHEIQSGDNTHVEYSPTNILSILANQTPFSDFNQSPRNMYQCLSADHEVLTQLGWKAITSITTTDQVMTMDLQTGTQQWNVIQAKTRLAHSGPLYRLKSDGIDAVCNESHRWYLNTKDQPNVYTSYTTQQMLDSQLVALKSHAGNNMGQWNHKSRGSIHTNHRIPVAGHNGNVMYTWPECSWLPKDFVTDEESNLDWCRFIGLVMGDGGIKRSTSAQGEEDYHIQIYQCVRNLAGMADIENLLKRLAAKLPDFVVNTSYMSSAQEKHTWNIKHRDMYHFFLPMLRGPQSYDPLDDSMCRAYQASRYQTLPRSDNAPILRAPTDWKTGDWWHLRRWIGHSWLYSLSRNQARAIIRGIAVADGEWSLSFKSRSKPGSTGRSGGEGSVKRIRLSMHSVQSEQLSDSVMDRGVFHVFNSSIPLTHDLSVLGLLAETRVKVGVKHRKGEWMPSIGRKADATRWRISFAFSHSELTVAAPRPAMYDNPRHDGFVYCLTVPNGNFLARRSVQYSDDDNSQEVLDAAQKPFYTGNCQMGKQTMGTFGTAIKFRSDNKAYRLQTGQTPIVRAPLHNAYGLDNFPNGTNSVVAVISYTGYDMDDAMIINKASHERGFGHGTIYKTVKYSIVETSMGASRSTVVKQLFGFPPTAVVKAEALKIIDFDGLPRIGVRVRKGDVIAASYNVVIDPKTGEYVNTDGVINWHKYKDDEVGYVEEVRLCGSEEGNKPLQLITVRYRIPRSPIVGDKFSSRHGQKGVCSQKWQQQDMPWTESGMQPDTIINPHAFPSRMTIGMFVESLAGKSGALHGLAQDCTPWSFDEENTAVDYFGHQLEQAGYNYYGNEPMYSGITGKELQADIYIGLVYYQRLRHMVNDKYQVRTTGPVHKHTLQPVKGRKKGGGIRIGEMERDSLLAHGTAFLLQDRLLNCSDYTQSWICKQCGLFLGTTPTMSQYGFETKRGQINSVRCLNCAHAATGKETRDDTWEDGHGHRWKGGDHCRVIAVPGVLRYLDTELASMGVKMKFKIEP